MSIKSITPWFNLQSLRGYVLLLAIVFVILGKAAAQADFEKGFQAYQSYHGSDFDVVNLANGNLVFAIPLLSYEQRGDLPPLVISIRSNSTTFQSSPPYLNGPLDTTQHEVASGVIGAPWGQPHVSISPGGLSWREERVVTSSKTATGGAEYLTRFVALDDSGATHSLGGNVANLIQGAVPGIRYSVDGSGLMLQPGTAQSGPLIVDRKGNTGGLVDHNGNAITLHGQCATPPGSGDLFDASLASWEVYAHGIASATSITDSIGRVIPNPTYLPPASPDSCIVDLNASYRPATPDANGCETYYFPAQGTPAGPATIPLTFCYEQIAVNSSLPTPLAAGSPVSNGGTNTSSCGFSIPGVANVMSCETINEVWWVLKSVTLPNGTQWSFGYNNDGQVKQVTTPTGATIGYQYAKRLACGNPPGQVPVTGVPSWPYSNLMSSDMVTTRTLDLHDTSSLKVWTYTNQVGSGWAGSPNSGTVTVNDPDANDTVHTFTLQGALDHTNPILIGNEQTSPNSTCGPYESQTQYYQGLSTGGGTLLKQVDTVYSSTGTDFANPTNFSNYVAVGVFPQAVKTTIATSGSNLVSQDSSVYDAYGTYQDYIGNTHPFSFGQMLSACEADWGGDCTSGSRVIRTSFHAHAWQSNYNYYAANMIDLPCLDTVFAGYVSGSQRGCTLTAPPLAGQASQTSYSFDEAAFSYNGSLGNMTSVSRWLNTSSTPLTTHDIYTATSFGMPVQKIDARGDSTLLTYDPSGLYISALQHPSTYANGTLVTHVEGYTYDDTTGLLLRHIDENSQQTSFLYDSMRRLQVVHYPDSGSESYLYNDTPHTSTTSTTPSFTFIKAINTGLTYTATGIADALGRMIQSQVTDPEGTVYKDTAYDNLGRVASVSNPYRTTSDPTYGVTTYQYDALSRKVEQTQPDSSSRRYWCYSGIALSQPTCAPANSIASTDWVNSKDELGNNTQTRMDGLSRLVGVTDATNLGSTVYSYDVLGNLLTVDQVYGATSVQQRRFSYDSLSRLLTSFNPESGPICYGQIIGSACQANGYDANNNLRYKTDARGITTHAAYDALNRVVATWFTGDPAATPFSCYQYDVSAFALPVSNANLIGRLSNAWTQKAACPDERSATPGFQPNSILSRRSIQNYDPMGRILNEQQCTYFNCSSGQPYVPAYTYDLAGNMITHTSGIPSGGPAGYFVFTNIYDAANRLVNVSNGGTSLFSISTTPVSSGCPGAPAAGLSGYNPAGGVTSATFGSNLQLTRTYDNRMRINCEIDTGYITQGPTQGTAIVQILGSEQTH